MFIRIYQFNAHEVVINTDNIVKITSSIILLDITNDDDKYISLKITEEESKRILSLLRGRGLLIR